MGEELSNRLHIALITGNAELELCVQYMATNDPWITLDLDKTTLRQALTDPFTELWGIYSDSQIAGFILLELKGAFKGYIRQLGVLEAYQNLGLGSRLLDFAVNRISDISPNVFICVSEFNSGAINLYSRKGFEIVGRLCNYVKDGYDEILMRKSFSSWNEFRNRKDIIVEK